MGFREILIKPQRDEIAQRKPKAWVKGTHLVPRPERAKCAYSAPSGLVKVDWVRPLFSLGWGIAPLWGWEVDTLFRGLHLSALA
jgi:hypothetical protein